MVVPGQTSQALLPWKDVIKPELSLAEPMFLRLAPEQFKRQVPRLITSLQSAAKKTPKIYECELPSIVLAMAQAASIGIIPNSPCKHADWIPRGGKLNFELRYNGMIELAQRTSRVSNVRGVVVYKGDEFILEEGTDPRIVHRPNLLVERADEDIIGVYGVIKFRDGSTKFRFMNRAEVLKRKAVSKGSDDPSSPWQKWFREMCEKTGVKYVLANDSLSDDDDSDRLGRAIAHDNGDPIDVPGYEVPESAPASAIGSLAQQASAAAT